MRLKVLSGLVLLCSSHQERLAHTNPFVAISLCHTTGVQPVNADCDSHGRWLHGLQGPFFQAFLNCPSCAHSHSWFVYFFCHFFLLLGLIYFVFGNVFNICVMFSLFSWMWKFFQSFGVQYFVMGWRILWVLAKVCQVLIFYQGTACLMRVVRDWA